MRRILVALGILVAMAVISYQMMERKQTREQETAEQRKLLTLDERKIRGLRATVDGVEWVVDRSGDGTWEIVQPIRDPADPDAVMNMLRLMNQTEILETIDEPEPLSAYGLDPARAELRIVGVDLPVVYLGNETPTGNSIFMRVEGRPGVLVAQIEYDSPFLNPDLNRLRENSLPGISINDIQRVAVREDGEAVILEKEGEHWWITGPRRLPASTVVLTGLLEALANAEVVGFIDGEDPTAPRFRLDDSALVVELTGKAGARTITLGRGTDSGVRFAARDDREAIMAVFEERLFSLPREVNAFLDNKLTKANRYKVQWFRYESGGRSLELRRDPEREIWIAVGGSEFADEAIFPILVRLLEARLLGWRPGSAPASSVAILEYEQSDGMKDRLLYGADGAASLDSVPGVVFAAKVRLPEIPG